MMSFDGNFPSLLSDAYPKKKKKGVNNEILIKILLEMLEFKSVCYSTLLCIVENT
jgi:hypothetical protein